MAIAFSKKSRLIRGSPFSVFELFTHTIIMDSNANFGPVSYKGSDNLFLQPSDSSYSDTHNKEGAEEGIY